MCLSCAGKKREAEKRGVWGGNGFRAILSIFSLFDLFSDAVTSGMRRSLVQRSVFFLDVGAGFLLWKQADEDVSPFSDLYISS